MTASSANPLAGKVRWAIGRGVSQSGNYLRSFIHLGFNTAEDGRIVFDGLNPIVGPRMLSMNHRFATPGGLVGLYELGSDGPNWWSAYNDMARGQGKHSLLDRCLKDNRCPKIAEILGSTEFWDLHASPDFVGTDAKADIPLPANVRRYYNAGAPHNGGRGGFDLVTPATSACVLISNPNPASDTNKAIFAALVDWVTKGTEPPPSIYPTLASGALVTPAAYDKAFPKIAGVPRPAYSPTYQYDLGKSFDYADLSGAITVTPPRVIKATPQLMPRIDADGNELDGIRSPLISAPLGTYVGWNVFAAGFEKGRFCNNIGGYIPFAATKAERMAKGDPRPVAGRALSQPCRLCRQGEGPGRCAGGQALYAAGRCGTHCCGSGSRQTAVDKKAGSFDPAFSSRPRKFVYFTPTRTSSRMRRARVVLKMPQEQKRDMASAASLGVRRFSFTKLIIFWAKLMDSMPWPHMVDSMIACLAGHVVAHLLEAQRIGDGMARDAGESCRHSWHSRWRRRCSPTGPGLLP